MCYLFTESNYVDLHRITKWSQLVWTAGYCPPAAQLVLPSGVYKYKQI